VKNWQEILNNEAQKVDKLEMVLAVVGTMKAGKSTTINAIVGSEILPNRNHPMTSLPTLIKHRIGQKEALVSQTT
jgi:replication fork clamp-binding protein CrfC